MLLAATAALPLVALMTCVSQLHRHIRQVHTKNMHSARPVEAVGCRAAHVAHADPTGVEETKGEERMRCEVTSARGIGAAVTKATAGVTTREFAAAVQAVCHIVVTMKVPNW